MNDRDIEALKGEVRQAARDIQAVIRRLETAQEAARLQLERLDKMLAEKTALLNRVMGGTSPPRRGRPPKDN